MPNHNAWNSVPIFENAPDRWQRYHMETSKVLIRLKTWLRSCFEIGAFLAHTHPVEDGTAQEEGEGSFISNAEASRLFEEYVQREAQDDAAQEERARKVPMVAVTT